MSFGWGLKCRLDFLCRPRQCFRVEGQCRVWQKIFRGWLRCYPCEIQGHHRPWWLHWQHPQCLGWRSWGKDFRECPRPHIWQQSGIKNAIIEGFAFFLKITLLYLHRYNSNIKTKNSKQKHKINVISSMKSTFSKITKNNNQPLKCFIFGTKIKLKISETKKAKVKFSSVGFEAK